MAMHDNTQASRLVENADIVIPLHTEGLSIDRRPIVRGTIRVDVRTHTREQVVDELLEHERVEIERVPIDRMIETMPDIREEGDTTIIPVVEEVIVTERRLVLKEEIRLRRVRTTERHHETIVLRSQDADIVRTGPAHPDQTT